MDALPTLINIDKIKDHLANERTFLAWIRTSISIIVFGFVVAKFGITLREFLFTQKQNASESNITLYIGLGFMAMGIILAAASFLQYRLTMSHIEKGQFKPSASLVALLMAVTVLFGIILIFYLVWTAKTNLL